MFGSIEEAKEARRALAHQVERAHRAIPANRHHPELHARLKDELERNIARLREMNAWIKAENIRLSGTIDDVEGRNPADDAGALVHALKKAIVAAYAGVPIPDGVRPLLNLATRFVEEWARAECEVAADLE